MIDVYFWVLGLLLSLLIIILIVGFVMNEIQTRRHYERVEEMYRKFCMGERK